MGGGRWWVGWPMSVLLGPARLQAVSGGAQQQAPSSRRLCQQISMDGLRRWTGGSRAAHQQLHARTACPVHARAPPHLRLLQHLAGLGVPPPHKAAVVAGDERAVAVRPDHARDAAIGGVDRGLGLVARDLAAAGLGLQSGRRQGCWRQRGRIAGGPRARGCAAKLQPGGAAAAMRSHGETLCRRWAGRGMRKRARACARTSQRPHCRAAPACRRPRGGSAAARP